MKGMLGIAAGLVVLWLVLWLGLKIASFAVHLLLVVAAALVIWGLVKKAV